MATALSGPLQSLSSLGSVRTDTIWTKKRPNCPLPSPHVQTSPGPGMLDLLNLPRTRNNKSRDLNPRILERSGRQHSLLHQRLSSPPTATSTSMDTGCPGRLMLLPRPLLPRNRVRLARTLGVKEITNASHPGIRAKSIVVALLIVIVPKRLVDLRETPRLRGVTAVARGVLNPLHLPHGTIEPVNPIEALHPGGETGTHEHSHLDLFCEAFYFFSVGFRQKDI